MNEINFSPFPKISDIYQKSMRRPTTIINIEIKGLCVLILNVIVV